MKKICVYVVFTVFVYSVNAQSAGKIITARQVKKIEKILSADDMQGRRTFTPAIEKASAFIETQFKKAGLQTFKGAANYRQEFFISQAITGDLKISIDGKSVTDSLIIMFSYQPTISLTEKNDVEIVKINTGDKFAQKFYEYYQSRKNLLVLVDSSFENRLKGLRQMDKISANPAGNSVVFVFGTTEATTFRIDGTNTITKKALNNVVGILPGKSKPNEYVVFSAHYDHLGVGSPAEGVPHDNTDSIYNGANDDAAGTTAVILGA